MDWALVRNRMRPSLPERLALALLSCLVAAPIGCAQFYGNRSSEPQRLGTVAPPSTDSSLARQRPATTPNPSPGLEPARASSGQQIVRSTIHPTPASNLPVAAAPALDVELRPPVALDAPVTASPRPPASESRPALADRPAASPSRDPLAATRSIVAEARAKLESMDTYQVHLNRQENVGGQIQPAEDVLLSIRREPKAVRLEWPTGPSKGREVIFSSSDPRGLLHVHMGNPLVPAVSMRPDSPLVMRSSRHPITEAGFATIIENLEKGLAGVTPGAKIAYHGIETPSAVGRPCHQIVRTTPGGDLWMVFIDTETKLPAMVAETTATGEILERYVFRDVVANVPALASADAFDPDKRWSSASGLLGRLARSAGVDAKPTATPPPH
jgi:hypothetical protein